MSPPHYRSHVHSGCQVSRKSAAAMSLLLWHFIAVLPLVQAGAHPWDLASLWLGNFINRFQRISVDLGTGSERAVLLVSTRRQLENPKKSAQQGC